MIEYADIKPLIGDADIKPFLRSLMPTPEQAAAMRDLGIEVLPIVPAAPVAPARLKDADGFARVLGRVLRGIDDLSDGVNAGVLSPVQWHNEMARLLLIGHTAAYQEGRGVDTVSTGARRIISQIVGEQVEYLNGFLDKVEADGWNDARDRQRAALYAGSLKHAFSRGATFGLEMPFYPTVGSECMVNCKCSWQIDWEDQEELNATAYWRMGRAEHCPTCTTRAMDSPYIFRGGVLQ